MRELLADAAQRALAYLTALPERAVAPSPQALAALAQLDTPLHDAPRPAAQTLQLLDAVGSPATVASAGGRYFGFVTGAALPASVAAHWLATAWDQNTAYDAAAPATSRFEAVALRWVLDLLGLPADAAGAFVTGATMANFSALAAARHAVLESVGWSVEADGLFGAPPITVIVGDEVHPSVVKALGLLGLGRERVQRVPVDAQGRMRADRLPRWDGPCIVCTQAGNVNTGAFDPLADIVDAAHARAAWVHVDGAFGLWAAACPSRAALTHGMANADSWATDAHKWLNVPYDCGLAVVRDGTALRAAMAISAHYLPGPDGARNPADTTPELSRRARGVDVWAALHSLGRAGVAELVQRNCEQAQRLARGLQQAGHAVLNEVVLNQVLVRFGSADHADDATRRIVAELQQEGSCWCGITQWQGRVAMRISVSSWATVDADIERGLQAMLRIAARVLGAPQAGAPEFPNAALPSAPQAAPCTACSPTKANPTSGGPALPERTGT